MTGPIHVITVPDEVKRRLKRAESNQRSRAKALNKKIITRNSRVKEAHQLSLIVIEKIDIVELFTEQEWSCQCDRVHGRQPCFKYVDITKSGYHPDAPVIGHINNLDNGGHHIRDNVGVMRHECNMEICHTIEKKRSSKTERLRRTHSGVKKNGQQYVKKQKSKIPARPGGLQSRSSFGNQKRPWPKRKFGQ